MKKSVLKITGLILIAIFIFSSNTSYAQEKTMSDFKDIPSDHWGISAIKWGLENDIISGYGDGKFAPNDHVTEAEFATILARYASNLPDEFPAVVGKHWSEPYYNELWRLQMPFKGYENTELRNTSLQRGNVAVIVAAKYGFALTVKQAVYFMYENGLSNGNSSTERTYESFGASDVLTRTQAVAFLQNMDNLKDKVMTFKGKESLKGPADATTILGMGGLNVDSKIVVDFGDFNAPVVAKTLSEIEQEVEKYRNKGTKVVDGKVVIDHVRLITPTDFSEVFGKYYTKTVNYVDFSKFKLGDANLANSVVLYKGVELPFGKGFIKSDDMLKINDQQKGIVQVGISISSDESTFKDKDMFIALISNLKFLGATQGQIDKSVEYVNKYYGINNRVYQQAEIVSKSTGYSIVVTYGKGDVTLGLYSDTFGWKDVTTYVE
ncbi:MAG: S-layer homology domain-containing protein [Clostridia bacterium]|nr:S-layer homology domain-containing protein [Clostridia bacterium]